jgi:hypothetical protein
VSALGRKTLSVISSSVVDEQVMMKKTCVKKFDGSGVMVIVVVLAIGCRSAASHGAPVSNSRSGAVAM